MAKVSPISRSEFKAHAKTLECSVKGENGGVSTVYLSPKDFSTGSMGWYAQGKGLVLVNGVPTEVQMNIMYTVIGSKELPKAPAAA